MIKERLQLLAHKNTKEGLAYVVVLVYFREAKAGGIHAPRRISVPLRLKVSHEFLQV